MNRSKDFDYGKSFDKCEDSENAHMIKGIVYPTSFGPHKRGYCLKCGNILETYDGIHYLWLHRVTEEIFIHFQMEF